MFHVWLQHNTSQPKTQSFQRSSLASAGTTHAAFGTTREQLSNASGQCADISTRTHPPEPARRETPLKAAGHLGSRKQIAKKRINYKDLIGRDIEIPADVFDVQVSYYTQHVVTPVGLLTSTDCCSKEQCDPHH
jgi:hypothetical protein